MAVEKEKLIDMYRIMVRIRIFEERVRKEFAAGHIGGFVHLYAGEVPVALVFLLSDSNQVIGEYLDLS